MADELTDLYVEITLDEEQDVEILLEGDDLGWKAGDLTFSIVEKFLASNSIDYNAMRGTVI